MSLEVVCVKEEPEWVADDAAVQTDVYGVHKVKEELVVGLGCLQPPDETYAVHAQAVAVKVECKPALTDGSMKLLVYHTQLNTWQKTAHAESSQSIQNRDETDEANETYGLSGAVNQSYKCDVCSETFPLKHSLMDHVAIHVKVKNEVGVDNAQEQALAEKIGSKQTPSPVPALGDEMPMLSDHSVKLERLLSHQAPPPLCPTSPPPAPHQRPYYEIRSSKRAVPLVQIVYNIRAKGMARFEVRTSNFVVGPQPRAPGGQEGADGYVCNTCGHSFPQKCDLIQHIQLHLWNKSNKTKLDNQQKLPYSNNMAVLNQSHSSVKRYSCEICSKQFAYSHNLTTHKRIHTGQMPYSCALCGQQFKYSSGIKVHNVHMRIHTGEKPYSCEVCKKKFRLSISLKRHMRIHTNEKPYRCKICVKQFTLHSTLRVHMRVHKGEKPYSCETCDKHFAQLAHLQSHNRIHTRENCVKPYSCETCQKQFAESVELEAHKRIHTKLYSCELCEKKFTRSINLKKHKKIHTHSDETPYSCEICHKRFKLPKYLKFHLKRHTDKKQYSCDICQKHFAACYYLKAHMRIHTGEIIAKPYSCELG